MTLNTAKTAGADDMPVTMQASAGGRGRQELAPDALSVEICSKILKHMKSVSITQKELAVSLGCSEACVSRQLSGDVNLTLKTVARLLAALDLKMDISLYDKKVFDCLGAGNWKTVTADIQDGSECCGHPIAA